MNMSDPLVGHVLDGRYEITRKIARGGMATVYLATDHRLTRTVAVKVMHEGLGDDQDFIRKFDREARAAARLAHPNVVAVFDQGLDRGRPYIVMEYVEGCTLRHVMTREAPMDPKRALDLIEPVVGALAAAHETGLIHLDIKPENVLISDRGQIKVADFGLSRAISTQTATATQGLLIGTVSYIAPEMVTQHRPDPRADVYAVGVVLYEMLTGHKPHTGDTPIQVAYSHVHNQVPPPSRDVSTSWRDSRSGIPPYLDALVTTAAARQPKDRPQNGKVLLNHLRLAREALARSVMDDPRLTAQMQQTQLEPGNSITETVPVLRPPGEDPNRAPTLRFTVSTPVSPGLPPSSDGVPYYDSEPPAGPQQHRRPDARAKRRRRLGWTRLALIIVMSVALGVGAWWFFAGRYTPMPDLTRLTQAQAVTKAQSLGFTIVFDRDFSEDVPIDLVARTSPSRTDRIPFGGRITAYLSKGPERYPVPGLTGLTLDAAKNALATNNLTTGTVTDGYDDVIPNGVVISGSIPSGTQVKPGTPVNLVVSKGPAPVQLANYVGKPFALAKQELEAAGLKVVVTAEQNSKDVPAGAVISQNPGPAEMHRGDTISFVVSKGPILVKVPYVRYMTIADATTEMKKAGFNVTVVYVISNGFGRVLNTTPDAGEMAPEGSTITLNVA